MCIPGGCQRDHILRKVISELSFHVFCAKGPAIICVVVPYAWPRRHSGDDPFARAWTRRCRTADANSSNAYCRHPNRLTRPTDGDGKISQPETCRNAAHLSKRDDRRAGPVMRCMLHSLSVIFHRKRQFLPSCWTAHPTRRRASSRCRRREILLLQSRGYQAARSAHGCRQFDSSNRSCGGVRSYVAPLMDQRRGSGLSRGSLPWCFSGR